MNYLAHAYLSFDQPEILAGNMISDFIKGRKKFDYPENIRKGIELHRAIDEFTDHHETTKQAKQFFRSAYGLYAGAFIDIVYDHFLATDPNCFPVNSLDTFAQKTYGQLQSLENILPERFRRMLYYMRTQNWLYNYQFYDGVKNSFAGLVRRAAYMHEHETAFALFKEHHSSLQIQYEVFFPDLKRFAAGVFQQLASGS